VCHISPPVGAASFPHSGKTIADDCAICHGHNGSGPSHIDGVLLGSGGACTGCHDYDTGAGAWGSGTDVDLVKNATAWGAHKKHIDHLKVRNGAVLTAATDTYGNAQFNKVCGVCHSQNAAAAHKPDGGATTRQVNFNASTAHLFGSQPTPSYGSGAKSCNSLDCHFKGTPVW
jgi:cytochrome c